ncbi:MAG: hypothetical protein OEV40_00120 [Acidimicrobiia bacterium]|nr:hypothetical protein [Acidimicrobiia bacterium]
MASIDTPLLVVGHGPAALVAAKVASGRGLSCLIVGHEPIVDDQPVVLDEESLRVLEPNGVLGVLRPYASARAPFTIAPTLFEQALKHHCVADMLVTVYDRMWVDEQQVDEQQVDELRPDGGALSGVLTDGRSRWELRADAFLDVSALPTELNGAIREAARFATALVDGISESTATG